MDQVDNRQKLQRPGNHWKTQKWATQTPPNIGMLWRKIAFNLSKVKTWILCYITLKMYKTLSYCVCGIIMLFSINKLSDWWSALSCIRRFWDDIYRRVKLTLCILYTCSGFTAFNSSSFSLFCNSSRPITRSFTVMWAKEISFNRETILIICPTEYIHKWSWWLVLGTASLQKLYSIRLIFFDVHLLLCWMPVQNHQNDTILSVTTFTSSLRISVISNDRVDCNLFILPVGWLDFVLGGGSPVFFYEILK